jgi:hypothetical protein
MQRGLIRERPRKLSSPRFLVFDAQSLKPLLPGMVQMSLHPNAVVHVDSTVLKPNANGIRARRQRRSPGVRRAAAAAPEQRPWRSL